MLLRLTVLHMQKVLNNYLWNVHCSTKTIFHRSFFIFIFNWNNLLILIMLLGPYLYRHLLHSVHDLELSFSVL